MIRLPPGPSWPLCTLALWTLSSAAHAGNEDEMFVGNRAAMTGGAVVATVQDGSATYYNPAGLGGLERSAIDVSASAYALRFLAAPGFLSAEDGSRQDAAVTEFVAIPTQISYVRKVGAHTSLGLGYFVPRATDLLLREHLDTDPENGALASHWALDLRISGASYLLGAGLGTRVTPWLRLGVALFGSYTSEIESATLHGGVDERGVAQRLLHLSALSSATVVGAELLVGGQLDLGDGLQLGLALRSPRVRLWRALETSFSSAAVSVPVDEEARITRESGLIEEGGDVRFERLGRAHVGLAYQLDEGVISAGGDFQPALSDREPGLKRKAAWNARAGYAHAVDSNVTLGLGVFTDRTTDDLSDAFLGARADFYGVCAGLQLDSTHRLAEGEPVPSLMFSTVFALRYAYGSGDSAVVRADPRSDSAEPFRAVSGRFYVHELGLHVGSALHF